MIDFFVPGVPATKGSARAFVRNGRAIVTNDNPKAKGWASTISLAAHEAMGGAAPLDCAVAVSIDFVLPRPQSHFTKRGLRPDAPRYSPKKPDVDKVLRCALDALTAIVFDDDAQIAVCTARKLYAGPTRPPGAHFTIRRVTDDAALFNT